MSAHGGGIKIRLSLSLFHILRKNGHCCLVPLDKCVVCQSPPHCCASLSTVASGCVGMASETGILPLVFLVSMSMSKRQKAFCLWIGKDSSLWLICRYMSGSLMKYLEKLWGRHWDGNQEGFPFLLDSVFLFVCFLFLFVFIHSGQVEWCCLGLHQIVRRCPLGVLCWLLPLPAFAARGQEVAQVQAKEAETPAHWCPSTWSHWAEHQDLELFFVCLFYLFFPNNCWEKFHWNLKGGVEGVEWKMWGKCLGFVAGKKRQFPIILLSHRFGMEVRWRDFHRPMTRAWVQLWREMAVFECG